MSQPSEPSSVNPYQASSVQQPQADIPAEVSASFEEAVRVLFDRGRNGANWFYWVAGLSAINSVVALAGGDISFVLGLSATMFADGIAAVIAKEEGTQMPLVIAAVFDVLVLGMVVLCGWLSRKRILIVYALGMLLYLLDGLIFLALGEIMGVAIHAFALWGMWSGFSAYRHLNALERHMAQSDWQAAPAAPPAT